MREILFRGKKWKPSVFDETDWVYGSLIDSGNHDQVAIYPWYHGASTMSVRQLVYARIEGVKPETVGQYTGLTDKNGKMIFEGDLVKAESICNGDAWVGTVVWWNGCFAIQGVKDKNVPAIDLFRGYEVIDNIHDNPELLEV